MYTFQRQTSGRRGTSHLVGVVGVEVMLGVGVGGSGGELRVGVVVGKWCWQSAFPFCFITTQIVETIKIIHERIITLWIKTVPATPRPPVIPLPFCNAQSSSTITI